MQAFGVFLLDRADRRWRGEQRLHPVLGGDAPKRARIRGADGLALVQHGRRAEQQRPVDDVGVADDPTDIGCGPIDFARLRVVDVAHAPQQCHRMSAVVADDALRLTGGAGGVQHVQGVGRGDRNRVDGLRIGHQLVPVVVAAGERLARPLLALQDDARRWGVLGDLQRGVEHRLVVDGPGRLDATRCRHDDRRLRVVDARREFVRGEPAEHHRMHRAEPCARQHRDHRLGHHRHVDDDSVALADTQAAQHSGEARGLVQQLAVGVGALRPGYRRVVDQRRLLGAAAVDVAVQRVGAGVQLAVGKPAVERRIGVIEDALRFARPCHRPRGVGPEGRGIGDAGVEQVAISAHTRTVAREWLPIVRFMADERSHVGSLPT